MENFSQVLMTKKYFFMIWIILIKDYPGEPVMEFKISNGRILMIMFSELLSKMKKYACKTTFIKLGCQVELVRSNPYQKSSCRWGLFSRLQQEESSSFTFRRVRWRRMLLGHKKSQQKSLSFFIQGSYFCWT